jgi:selenocysteine lyase/cysteine desulfurase
MLALQEYAPRVADFDTDLAQFEAEFPRYRETASLDHLRAREYRRLDDEGQVYLDYTGGGLHAASQMRAHLDLLDRHVFGNPHSHNPTSLAMTERIEAVRAYVLDYFNASPAEYSLVFTPNASGAIKLVGEAYPFTPAGHYLLTADNHNSTNGVRVFARAKGAAVTYIPVTAPDLRLDLAALPQYFERAVPGAGNLFAYVAQSNYSGVQHPLELIELAQAKGWDVLLDASAFVPTNRLDLGRWKPDFVPLSFYKIFGYPTGLGCLIVRKTALARLRRPWFAGGAIALVSVKARLHKLMPGEMGFEDGTVNYLNIPAVRIGLEHIQSIGLDTIRQRVMILTEWLMGRLLALRHDNGRPLVHLHGPRTMHRRGGTLTMNFHDPAGEPYDVYRVEQLANARKISLRTGCFCNPGASEIAHDLPRDGLITFMQTAPLPTPPTLNTYMLEHHGKAAAATRVSIGLVTNFADVYAFYEFARELLNRPAGTL